MFEQHHLIRQVHNIRMHSHQVKYYRSILDDILMELGTSTTHPLNWASMQVPRNIVSKPNSHV